jgi:hypothetical protein
LCSNGACTENGVASSVFQSAGTIVLQTTFASGGGYASPINTFIAGSNNYCGYNPVNGGSYVTNGGTLYTDVNNPITTAGTAGVTNEVVTTTAQVVAIANSISCQIYRTFP